MKVKLNFEIEQVLDIPDCLYKELAEELNCVTIPLEELKAYILSCASIDVTTDLVSIRDNKDSKLVSDTMHVTISEL